MTAADQTARGFFPGRAPIEAYGNGGFRFAGMSHRGSLLLLPSGVHAWQGVTGAAGLGPEQFARVAQERADIEVMLLGTGTEQVFPSWELRTTFADWGIALEAMSTGAACRTWNVLLGEGRRAAAALISV